MPDGVSHHSFHKGWVWVARQFRRLEVKMQIVTEVADLAFPDPLAVVAGSLAVVGHGCRQQALIDQIIDERELAPRSLFVASPVKRLSR